ncbi:DsbA family protein [Sphingosinithalassobacter tenebrarum]|uniref:DsbA family protein n=2 Tax=Stakelama tenebrarum TaxID=2711215 RepID=A0A6G6YAU3_9SPHN|nr:DsbA family protein [Sphingosinithalassobacter tenebrarum]
MQALVRKPWLLAVGFVLAAMFGAGIYATAQAVAPDTIPAPERARMEKVVRDYLLEHPEILPQAMERLQQRQTAKSIADNRSAVFDPFAGAWAGNPQGDVTISVYMDYACGYCRASLPAIDKLLKTDGNVRIIYREYPILSDQSVTAARWALAAAEQDRFRVFHDAMFAQGQLDSGAIARAAQQAGLDLARARAAINSDRIEQELRGNHALARSLGISGTPAWVVGDRLYSGALDYSSLKSAVSLARRES